MTRLLREVTREEWVALPVERCYGKLDETTGVTSYYEIIPTADDHRVPVKGLVFTWIDPSGTHRSVRMVVTSVSGGRVYATSLHRWEHGKTRSTVTFYGVDKWRQETEA